jgi:hypothetical protein
MGMDTVPTTLETWIAKAQHFSVQRSRIQAIRNNKPWAQNSQNHSRPARDPDAMDVDRLSLTPLQKAEYVRKGLCFKCGQSGHISRWCKGKPKTPSTHTPTKTVRVIEGSSNPTPAQAYIQNLFKDKLYSDDDILFAMKECFDKEEEAVDGEIKSPEVDRVHF